MWKISTAKSRNPKPSNLQATSYKLQARNAFTLIEMLVVMAIFLTAMLIVSDLFMTINNSQQKTLAGQKAMNDLQFNLDDMVQKIRTSKLDYSAYVTPLILPATVLNLIDRDGLKYSIRKDSVNCKQPATSCLKMQNINTDFVLSTNQININRLDFYINPPVDPFTYNTVLKKFDSDEMPMVTIVLGGESLETKVVDRRQVNLQTTVSLRDYER